MGAIIITVGALTRTIAAPDGKISNVLGEVVEATNGPASGTPAAQIDHVLTVIRRHLVEVANGNRQRKQVAAAEAAATASKLDLNDV